MEVTTGVPIEQEAAAPFSSVGVVHVHTLMTPFENGLEVRLERFEPGARSRPHTSRSGRLLHVVAGEAVVAGPEGRIVVAPGDTVTVPAGEWHWQGGLPHVRRSSSWCSARPTCPSTCPAATGRSVTTRRLRPVRIARRSLSPSSGARRRG